MKRWILLPLLLTATPGLAGNWFGAGPFNNEGYWSGYLNGKYMGVVTGRNISGVLGFAIADGAPPFRINEQQQAQGDFDPAVTVNQTITPDPLQNYFAIFVEGRTYTGLTTAGVDLNSGRVAGALQGQNPVGLLTINTTDTFVAGDNATADALSIVNRGLSGGFRATIDSKKATFTFSGTGQLSTPANNQTVVVSADVIAVADPVGPPPRPVGVITNEQLSGIILTDTTDFRLSGIRTSFFSNNPAAQQDALQGAQGQ